MLLMSGRARHNRFTLGKFLIPQFQGGAHGGLQHDHKVIPVLLLDELCTEQPEKTEA